MTAREPKARLLSAKGSPLVRFRARAEPGVVRLGVERDSRRAAKQDQLLELSPSEARELMRALQGAADRADQLAYQAARAPVDLPLEVAVEQVAAALEFEPWCACGRPKSECDGSRAGCNRP